MTGIDRMTEAEDEDVLAPSDDGGGFSDLEQMQQSPAEVLTDESVAETEDEALFASPPRAASTPRAESIYSPASPDENAPGVLPNTGVATQTVEISDDEPPAAPGSPAPLAIVASDAHDAARAARRALAEEDRTLFRRKSGQGRKAGSFGGHALQRALKAEHAQAEAAKPSVQRAREAKQKNVLEKKRSILNDLQLLQLLRLPRLLVQLP